MAGEKLILASPPRRRAVCATLSVVFLAALLMPQASLAAPGGAVQRYVVVMRGGGNVSGALARHRVKAKQVYGHALRGFAADLARADRDALARDPDVAFIEADRVVELAAQVVPDAIRRVEATRAPAARIDGVDQRVNADIAIIDTGIQPDHPDLNVAGGHNCIDSRPNAWADGNGHGTHVAGIAAALDNSIGTVGVAPGARLWSVRVFDSSGFSRLSWIVCGIDWITAQVDPSDPTRPLFEVANMSLRDPGSDDGACGAVNHDAEHAAICRSVARGITYAVAAGNDSTTASRWIPAAYNEVITVSALADYNGIGGGGASPACSVLGGGDGDDSFADFSNYGSDVDLIAPGKCVYSTYPGSSYRVISGTSMATPSVTGAAALYKSLNPSASPAAVRSALRAAGSLDWFTSTDPDSTHEPLLNVYGFGGPADGVAPTASPPSARVFPASYVTPGGQIALRLTWTGRDDQSGVAHYRLQRSANGGAYANLYPANAAATSLTDWRYAGSTYRYRTQSWDHAGNPGSFATGAAWRLTGLQSTDASIAYRGTWRISMTSSAWGGGTKYAVTSGATATLRFTGRAVGWVAALGPGNGSARVFVDGQYVRTVNLFANRSHPRLVAFEQRWATSGTHTIALQVLGTAGHPRVDLDAFVLVS
jgi:subtilisin